MGRRIIAQSRGKGSPNYRAPSHRFKANLKHIKTKPGETVKGEIIDMIHDTARSAPIAKILLPNREQRFILVPEAVAVGDLIECGISAEIKPGNTLPISQIPEGTFICNVENRPDDGGQFARASGTYAVLISHEATKAVVQLPSKKMKWLNSKCCATIGVVAAGGRKEKPFLKAGKKFHKIKTRAVKWPKVSGVAMNAVDHPFGGGGWQHPGRPKTVSRNAPPGQKVGSIAARRTGKRR